MQPAAERAAEQHLDDLANQLAEVRRRHRITQQVLDRHLRLPVGTTRQRELGLYAALPLTEFASWARALALATHLADEYGRVLPAWMWHRPPHETSVGFEVLRVARTLDLRRDSIPCDPSVLADHVGITTAAWHDWIAGTSCPDLLSVIRACIALDVRVTLTSMWHEQCLTAVRVMQAASDEG